MKFTTHQCDVIMNMSIKLCNPVLIDPGSWIPVSNLATGCGSVHSVPPFKTLTVITMQIKASITYITVVTLPTLPD